MVCGLSDPTKFEDPKLKAVVSFRTQNFAWHRSGLLWLCIHAKFDENWIVALGVITYTHMDVTLSLSFRI